MIRDAGDNVHHFPDSLRRYINSRLNESVHDKPAAEMVDAANKGAVVEDPVGDEISNLLAAGTR
nr:putative exodeoxyribonuclease VIII [Raoultella sp. NCTC 9187]